MRGDHDKAASAFRAAMAIIERRPGYMQPIHAQAYAREAISLANLGRLPEAHARLSQMPSGGDYLEALRLVTRSYLTMVGGQPIAPDVVGALERTFLPIRGSWGGLALAAYGRERLGDPQAAGQLLSEERSRSGFDALPAVMPYLASYAQQRARS